MVRTMRHGRWPGRLVAAMALSGCFAICGFTGQVRRPADAASELRQLTERRFAANAANDRRFYEALIADNALIMLPNRRPLTKQEYLADEFQSRPANYRGVVATIHDFRALVDGDTGVASYLVVEPTPVGDQKFEVRTGRVDTYARSKGEWRLLSMTIAEVPSWPDVATIDPHLYSDYAGTYQVARDVFVVVTDESGHLMAEMTGQAKTELFPESATTFFDRSDSPMARTIFERDAAGKVVAQIYRSHGQKLRAVKVR